MRTAKQILSKYPEIELRHGGPMIAKEYAIKEINELLAEIEHLKNKTGLINMQQQLERYTFAIESERQSPETILGLSGYNSGPVVRWNIVTSFLSNLINQT